MGLINGIKRIFNLSPADPKAWNTSLWNLYGAQTASGEVVTEETALTYSAVWNAVTLISGTVGSLPLHLMQRQSDRRKRIADNVPLYRVLHDRPNPYMTSIQFRECMMAYVLTWGNAYAEIVSSGIEDVAELWPIPPNRMLDIRYKNGALSYEIQLDGGSKWFPRSKILHLAGLGFDGFQGYSPVAMARKSIGLGMAMETFGAEFFGQGTHPGVVVSHPGRLGPEAHTNLRKDLTDKYSGLGQAHRLMLLEEGMKIEKIGIPPEDSQFLQSRQFQVPEIARWFNLPPHKLKDLSKSSFNNIESEQISFVTDSILPWLVRLEQAYNAQLLTDAQRYNRKLYFKHVVEGLLRGDASSRADFYTKMFQIGAMSINEIREKEDLNPVDGGDVHFVPLNMTTLENAGKEPVEPETPQIEPDEAENEAVEAKKRRVVGNEDTEAEPVQAPGVVRIAYRKQDA